MNLIEQLFDELRRKNQECKNFMTGFGEYYTGAQNAFDHVEANMRYLERKYKRLYEEEGE